MTSSKKSARYAMPVKAVLMTAFILLGLTVLLQSQATGPETPELKGAPTSGGIYFIGNSMFGTGLDIEAAREALPGDSASLAYYDGHYTSMWYAAFRNALIPSGVKPQVVVWGFRPTYAVLPAFRQNRKTSLDDVHDPDDSVFSAILTRAGENGGSLPIADEPTTLLSIAEEQMPIVARRNDIANDLNSSAAQATALVFAKSSEMAADFAAPRSPLKISDIIISFTTGGEVTRADALVVDNGERFLGGESASFENSFVPPTVDLLNKADIPQLVVIFKPVAVFDGAMPGEAQAYYDDAVSWLDAEGVPYVDFVADPALTRDLYAKGDHYTSEGMAFVTARIVEALYSEGLVIDG